MAYYLVVSAQLDEILKKFEKEYSHLAYETGQMIRSCKAVDLILETSPEFIGGIQSLWFKECPGPAWTCLKRFGLNHFKPRQRGPKADLALWDRWARFPRVDVGTLNRCIQFDPNKIKDCDVQYPGVTRHGRHYFLHFPDEVALHYYHPERLLTELKISEFRKYVKGADDSKQ